MGKRSRPKRPGKSLLQAYVDESLHRTFKAFAMLNGKNATDAIAELMQEYVDKNAGPIAEATKRSPKPPKRPRT